MVCLSRGVCHQAAYLSPQVPQLYGDLALGHFAHVEAHSGDHVFTKRARRDDIDKGSFACILQPNQ